MNTLLATPARKKISLTALIDVVFILLMFFMLTSSFSQWQAVELAAPASGNISEDAPSQIVYLSELGDFTDVDGNQVTATRLLEIFDVAQSVVVIPNQQTQLQVLVNGIETLKAAGFARVTLAKPASDQNTAGYGN
ncbi:ExbD/TolR family protein [Halioxenophilus aromaticivorans]|uniref:Biopolymer transporter ExbD n=1 Tax=Halioxenophilus aromaticivorans TaxID=1306992 RepID=A0AAV3TYW2_9ALTE